jgi:hypothetical protein
MRNLDQNGEAALWAPLMEWGIGERLGNVKAIEIARKITSNCF